MPQLMPLSWVFSSTMILLLLLVFVMLYIIKSESLGYTSSVKFFESFSMKW